MTKVRGNWLLTIILSAVLILTGVALAGCSGGSDGSADTSSGDNDAAEQEVITLTFTSFSTLPQTAAKVDHEFIKRIEEVTNGRVKFQYYGGGTLISGNDAAAELGSGVADFGIPRVGYSPHGYDLNKAYMTFMFNCDPYDAEMELDIAHQIFAQYPQFDQEFLENGMVPYAGNASGTSRALFTTKPIKSLDDLKGASIRATGNWAEIVKGLGAEPVNIPISETYLALEKGTVDGVIGLATFTLEADKLAEVVKYCYDLKVNFAPIYEWAFCKATWDKLPDDIKQVFIDNRDFLEMKSVEINVADTLPAEEYAKSLGVQFLELSDEDQAKLYDVIDKVNRQVAADLDAKGIPGTEIYEATQKLIKEYKK
ncbi:MAG TPA: TRAP transporter substrate-binding protein DctP [Clostridia bacterium]|nr:TRAP transporter substrate-binding protein DctP [Clostridia bacterium]